MSEQLKVAYTNSQWVKSAAFVGLIAGGVFVYWLSGGFPPWAWRFLFQVLPQIPHLWQVQGGAVVLPLAGLVLLSAALFIMWVVLIISAIKVGMHWWHDYHERQHFAMDLQEAERLAEQISARDRESTEQVASVPTMVAMQRTQRTRNLAAASASISQQSMAAASASVSQQSYAVAQSSRNVRVPMQAAAPAYPAMRQRTERQVHIPPAAQPASMREQLWIVRPVADEMRRSEYETQPELPVLDDELDVAKHDTVPGREDEPENDAYDQPATPQGYDDEAEDDEYEQDDEQASTELVRQNELVQACEPLRLVVGVGLDPGIVRRDAPNEDNLFAIQGSRIANDRPAPVGLFVVADGMGGHANGREASHLAIQSISDVIVPVLMRNTDEDEVFPDLLKDGVHRANLTIYQRNRQRKDMMGTTLTAALVVDTTAYVVNVGDSRTYLYRQSEGLQPITRDHSHVARMVEHGVITREEMYTHPKRNQIYRCLGDKASVEVDDFVVPVRIDDILLLCSDGLWEMVRDRDIEKIIASSAPHPSQISAMLIQAALSRGGADNVSVVVVHVASAEG